MISLKSKSRPATERWSITSARCKTRLSEWWGRQKLIRISFSLSLRSSAARRFKKRTSPTRSRNSARRSIKLQTTSRIISRTSSSFSLMPFLTRCQKVRIRLESQLQSRSSTNSRSSNKRERSHRKSIRRCKRSWTKISHKSKLITRISLTWFSRACLTIFNEPRKAKRSRPSNSNEQGQSLREITFSNHIK